MVDLDSEVGGVAASRQEPSRHGDLISLPQSIEEAPGDLMNTTGWTNERRDVEPDADQFAHSD